MGLERTLVLVKPDAIQRGLVGEVIRRLEGKGLKLIGAKMLQLDEALLEKLYAHLAGKPFFDRIRRFMSSAPALATCWQGVECVEAVRLVCGITKSREAAPGTIRGDLAMSVQNNLVHASESAEFAQMEINMFFTPSELFDYPWHEHLVYSEDELKSNPDRQSNAHRRP